MSQRFNRRRMLAGSLTAAAGACLAPGAAVGRQSANEQLGVAIIGAGGQGAANLAAVASQRIVALCDVDQRRAARALSKYPNVRRFHDYRRMLDQMDGQIDAVVISAPNHLHAPASIMAMQMGKHCYCEKPLTHSVKEARDVARLAAQTKVATQMGTQIHASQNYRRIVELIRSGAIGQVSACHIRLSGGGTAADRPAETPSVPAGLQWNLWLGPAPLRPYHPCYVPHDWHYWWDFGGGPLGNMGCHYLDLAFWALELRYPTSIQAEGPPVHPESTPRPLKVKYQFPARGSRPPLELTWQHGTQRPAFWQQHKLPDWAWGVLVGSKGMLLVSYTQRMLWPEARFAGVTQPEPSIPDSPGHHQEWITACKSGTPTTCNFNYAGALTETVLLGNVAYRCGQRIEWDPVNLRITNCPAAEGFLGREYRKY